MHMTDTPIKISFAITVKNEGEYLAALLNQLVPYCEETRDEIVILADNPTDEYTLSLLAVYDAAPNINIHVHPFEKDFAKHKNLLNSLCTGDYIFQIDADESLHQTLLKYLHEILEYNANTDLFLIPRINVVDGITNGDLQQWGWQVTKLDSLVGQKVIDPTNEEYKMLAAHNLIIEEVSLSQSVQIKYYRPIVAAPDYQTRIYKNIPEQISWKGAVHERISGHETVAELPPLEEWSLYHIKTIDRQRTQNSFYEKLIK
jgi:hypothetical protein